MSYIWYKGPRCGREGCPSRRYRDDETGMPLCQNGHEHPELRKRGDQDEDEFRALSQGRTTRKEREKAEKQIHHFEGKEAFELYLVSYQLILRKQIWWLVHDRGLPSELEVLVHDLWALRLQKLGDRIPVDALDDGETQQLFSSQSENSEIDFDTDSNRAGTYETTHHSIPPLSTPRLDQTLALLYLSLTILRHPITLGDIHSWVSAGHLLYYHAVRSIPPDMLARLPATYHAALDPSAALTHRRLWTTTTALALHYQHVLGVQLPGPNAALLQYRAVADLALPLPAYHAARALAPLLGWAAYAWPAQERQAQAGRARRPRFVEFPDARLAGLLVVAVKLLYPFEGGERSVRGAGELAAAVVDWETWGRATEKFERRVEKACKGLGYEWAMGVQEEDVLHMSDEQVDEYLNWYSQSYMSDAPVPERSKQANFMRYLLETFPVEQRGKEPGEEDQQRVDKAKMERLNKVISSMKVQPVIMHEQEEGTAKVLRPGEGYKRYRMAKELPPHAKKFYEAVAKWVGFDLEMIIRAVFLTERALERWMNETKQKEKEHEKQKSTTISKGKQKISSESDEDLSMSKDTSAEP